MSTLSVATIKSQNTLPPAVQNSSGTEIGTFCRAWVNFNGTGTVAIRASFNVSSITDNGTGDYTVNFTTAMTDINYSSTVSISSDAGFTPQVVAVNSKSAGGYAYVTPTTSAFRFITGRATDGSPVDQLYTNAAVFR
jgi:hypothetical protein